MRSIKFFQFKGPNYNSTIVFERIFLKSVAKTLSYQSLSFWVSVTYFNTAQLVDNLESELQEEFTIIKDELNIPLRNPLRIIEAAYSKGKYKVM